VDVVVLAGMGSATMIEILEAKPELVLKLQQLVLQPMVGVGQMRKWLVENGWAINNEILVKDDGFIYTVLSALPGEQSISDWLTLELGPILLKEKPPLLKDYISKMLSDYENVLINLAQTQSQEVKQKRLDLLEKINLLKGVISSEFKG
jgi:tRNA (adenine22-N1)-methyltransferase